MDTLAKLNKSWIIKLEAFGRLLIPIGLVLGLSLVYFGVASGGFVLFCTFVPSIVVEMTAWTLLYKTVRCPECGANLAKYKNGKNIPINKLYTYFSKEEPYRLCGWK